LDAAIHFVNNGATKVYITARNDAKAAEAKNTIEARTGEKDIVDTLVLDMNTLGEVQGFMERLQQKVSSIGKLMNFPQLLC
jgi:hypothetical protein